MCRLELEVKAWGKKAETGPIRHDSKSFGTSLSGVAKCYTLPILGIGKFVSPYQLDESPSAIWQGARIAKFIKPWKVLWRLERSLFLFGDAPNSFNSVSPDCRVPCELKSQGYICLLKFNFFSIFFTFFLLLFIHPTLFFLQITPSSSKYLLWICITINPFPKFCAFIIEVVFLYISLGYFWKYWNTIAGSCFVMIWLTIPMWMCLFCDLIEPYGLQLN